MQRIRCFLKALCTVLHRRRCADPDSGLRVAMQDIMGDAEGMECVWCQRLLVNISAPGINPPHLVFLFWLLFVVDGLDIGNKTHLCPPGTHVPLAMHATVALRFRRRWGSNPSGKCSHERPTRGTVCGTMRGMCGADAGCLAINYQSLCASAWVSEARQPEAWNPLQISLSTVLHRRLCVDGGLG